MTLRHYSSNWRPFLVLVLVLGCLLRFSFSHAQQPSAETAASSIAADSKLQASRDTSEQLAVARAQLADAREFQASILSTVYWSLGTLAAVTVLLAGFGWFTNFRVYERDKAVLERELKATIASESILLRELVSTSAAAQLVVNDRSIGDKTSALEVRVQASTQERLSSLEKAQLTEISSLVKTHGDLRDEVLHVRLRLEKMDRSDAIRKNVLANALQSSMSILEIALSISDDYFISEALDMIKEDIEAIGNDRTNSVDNYQQGELVAALDRVRGRHSHSASLVKQKAVIVFG
jgi:hypothetical protein